MAVKEIKDTEFKQELASNKKVAVKYFADWCGSCKLFAPKYRRLSENEKYSGVDFLEINAEKNPEARGVAGVDNLPYFAVFQDGKLIEGYATSKEEAVIELLEKIN